jgi:hypothetical protein
MACNSRLQFPVAHLVEPAPIASRPLPPAPTAPRPAPARPLLTFCASCWGQRQVWEPGPLGLVPVVCEACGGSERCS